MKVADLIAKLSECPPDAEVGCFVHGHGHEEWYEVPDVGFEMGAMVYDPETKITGLVTQRSGPQPDGVQVYVEPQGYQPYDEQGDYKKPRWVPESRLIRCESRLSWIFRTEVAP